MVDKETFIDRVLASFHHVKPKGGGGWLARCSAHEDRQNSLSIDANDERVLLKCFAGCSAEAIVSAAGLVMSDLFAPDQKKAEPQRVRTVATVARLATAKGLPVELLTRYGLQDTANGVVIPYHNTDGTVAARSRLRKSVIAREGSIWLGSADEGAIVPYGLQDLQKAQKVRVVCVTEGESDFWTLRHAGFPALGIPGAEMVGRLQAEHFRGIDRVYITQDSDRSGAIFITKLRAAANRFGITQVFAVRMPAGCKDVNDLYRQDPSGFKATFTAMLKAAREDGPGPAANQPAGLEMTALGDLLAEPDESVRWVVDGRIPSGSVDMLAGKPKAGKSTTARDLAFAVASGLPWLGWATSPGPVWYVALEEKRSEVRKHFRAMGATGKEPIRFFISRAPEDLLVQLHAAAAEQKPVLIIIDTLQRLIRCRDMNDYAEVTTKFEPILSLARETSAALLLVHHAGKAARAGIDAVLGSTALTGSVDNVLVLSRSDQVRTLATIQRIGDDLDETILVLDKPTQRVQLGATRQEAEQSEVAVQMLGVLKGGVDLTERELDGQVEGRNEVKRSALRKLVTDRRVDRAGGGKRNDPFRYRLSDSRTLVPDIARGQANTNQKTTVSAADSTTYSCPQKTGDLQPFPESRGQAIDPVLFLNTTALPVDVETGEL